MKEIRIKDAIIELGKDKDPLFGSIQYEQPTNPHTIITVQTDNKIIQIPLSKIDLIIFKLDAETFGFIFKSQCFYDQENFNEWDKDTKRLASRELQPNF